MKSVGSRPSGPHRRGAVRRVVTLFLVISSTIGVAACTSGRSDSDSGAFPVVDLLGDGGIVVSTSSWRGQPLVVNFWYSTCAPCAQEMRDFAEVDDDVGDAVRFVGVDPLDTVEAMTKFASERGVTYDLFRDEKAELQTELAITGFPTTYFVSANGEILGSSGVLDADGLQREIRTYFGSDAGDR